MSDFVELEKRLEEEHEIKAESIKQLTFQDRLKIHAALTHDMRLKIMKYLSENDTASFSQLISFSHLKKEFNLNPNTLNYHLKVLEHAGLIRSNYHKEPNQREYSKYEVTNLGREMLRVEDYTKWL